VGGTLFFVADDGVSGRELWVSDGTTVGTVRVKDIAPGPADSFPTSLAVMGGIVHFAAYDGGPTGRELWRSDGTEAGTVLVKDINTNLSVNNGYSFPSFLTIVSGTLFFSANDVVHGVGLWRSDGTDAGSSWIKELAPLGRDPGIPLYFAALNGNLLFEAYSGFDASENQPLDLELWRSDGTAAGTVVVKDINPGQAD
jgi:ELWxxDGT repeat protein